MAGKKIQIIVKDTTGPAPDIAKRLAQELVVRDQVDFLAGFGLTPQALAVAPIAETGWRIPFIFSSQVSIMAAYVWSSAQFNLL